MKPCPPELAVVALTPYAHVADVEQSLAFYALLGLVPGTRFKLPTGKTVWADASHGSARIMLAQADGEVDPTQQAVLFYLYCNDVAAMRGHLLSQGVHDGGRYCGQPGPNNGCRVVFEVTHPHYMPAGQVRVADPDGFCLLIGQLK